MQRYEVNDMKNFNYEAIQTHILQIAEAADHQFNEDRLLEYPVIFS